MVDGYSKTAMRDKTLPISASLSFPHPQEQPALPPTRAPPLAHVVEHLFCFADVLIAAATR